MKKIGYTFFLSLIFMTACTTYPKSDPNLFGSYVSEIIPELGADFERIQLSFTENGELFFHIGNSYQDTFQFSQDSEYDSIYYLNIGDQEIMINLLEDNSFYIPYQNNEFKGKAVYMKYQGSAIQTPPLYDPKD